MDEHIPKTIHYFWFSGEPLSELAEKCISSWKKYCPDYEIREWNAENFDYAQCDYAKEAYAAKKWAFLTDYARLYVLYNYGGIYLDADVELLKSLDDVLINDAGIGFETKYFLGPHFMYAKKGNAYINYLLTSYLSRHFMIGEKYDQTTMPITVTRLTNIRYDYKIFHSMSTTQDKISFYPSDFFNPMNHATGIITITGNTHLIHHFGGSWTSKRKKEFFLKLRKAIMENRFILKYQTHFVVRKSVSIFLSILNATVSYKLSYLIKVLLYIIKIETRHAYIHLFNK